MTLGQKIKKARTSANMTQKELADTLSVTFQTVSKWENDTTEPDLATLRALSKALGCSLEYLVSDDEEEPHKPVEEEKPVSAPVPKSMLLCRDCGLPIGEGELSHQVERHSPSGVKETVTICHSCFSRHEEEMERRAKEVEDSLAPKEKENKGGIFHKITERNDKKPLIAAIIFGVFALIGTLVACLLNYEAVGLGWTIGAPILAGYALLSTIYCVFTASFVSDIFMAVAGWSIRFPGIIFSWDLEGFMWLIAMKILFFLLGIFIGIATFLLAVAISALFSVFAFIPLLIYNKTHY